MKANKTVILLFIYHLIFIVVAYRYVTTFGGDAQLYWFHNQYLSNQTWFHYLSYGTDFILFLNYPLVKMGLPFFMGFLIYGTMGFFGILKWMQWSELVIGKKLTFKGFNLLPIAFLLPNLHFWTATIGKEAIIFWGLASVIYAITTNHYKTGSCIIGCVALLMIRPHVAFILLGAMVITFLFQRKYSLKKKFKIFGIAFIIGSLLTYMILQISKIRYINWQRINYYNEYSILSLKNSGSYVPMLEYSYGYRLFSFYFRPIFYDAESFFSFFASLENLLILTLFIISLYCILFHFKRIKFPQWIIILFLYTLISGSIFIHRYSNLGLFMRTKIMFEPFFMVAILYVIVQTLNDLKSESHRRVLNVDHRTNTSQ